MDDTEEIKQKKADELKEYYKAQKEILQQIEAERQINILLRKLLTSEARERLKNVRLVNPELYYKSVQAIIAAAQTGKLALPLDDAKVKQLLMKLSEKKETKIVRK